MYIFVLDSNWSTKPLDQTTISDMYPGLLEFYSDIACTRCKSCNCNCEIMHAWFTRSVVPSDFVYQDITKNFLINVDRPLNTFDPYILLHDVVLLSGKPNYVECRLPVYTDLNIAKWREHVAIYRDPKVADFLEFGCPINFTIITVFCFIIIFFCSLLFLVFGEFLD